MSHFAELDENNKVIRVLVGDNNLPNEGYDFFVETFGGTWVQTSYNANIRGKFAAIGDTYDPEQDLFISSGIKVDDSEVIDYDQQASE